MIDLILMMGPAGKNEKVRHEDVEHYLRLGYKCVEQSVPVKEPEPEITEENNEKNKKDEENEEGKEVDAAVNTLQNKWDRDAEEASQTY